MRKRLPLVGVLAGVLVAVLAGCGRTSPPPQPTPTPLTMEQATDSLLGYLHDRYGEDFTCVKISHAPDGFGWPQPGTFLMHARVSGATHEYDTFTVEWRGDDPWDNYLLVKMRPGYQASADQILPSVYSEYFMRVELNGAVRDLPGDITESDFHSWATDNLSVSITVVLPHSEGATQESVDTEAAPLESQLSGFLAKSVEMTLNYYPTSIYESKRDLFFASDIETLRDMTKNRDFLVLFSQRG